MSNQWYQPPAATRPAPTPFDLLAERFAPRPPEPYYWKMYPRRSGDDDYALVLALYKPPTGYLRRWKNQVLCQETNLAEDFSPNQLSALSTRPEALANMLNIAGAELIDKVRAQEFIEAYITPLRNPNDLV